MTIQPEQVKLDCPLKVDALLVCIDLCANGYQVVVQHYDDSYWYIKMKHCKNRNIMELKYQPQFYVLYKNGKCVKFVEE